MNIPEKFVTDGLALAKGATVFGVPIETLTREELMACAANFAKLYQDQLRRRQPEWLEGALNSGDGTYKP